MCCCRLFSPFLPKLVGCHTPALLSSLVPGWLNKNRRKRSKRGRWVVMGVIPDAAHVIVEGVCLVVRSSWTHNSCLNNGLCVWWAKCNSPRRWFSRLEWQLVPPDSSLGGLVHWTPCSATWESRGRRWAPSPFPSLPEALQSPPSFLWGKATSFRVHSHC